MNRSNQRGFTLWELIRVIAYLGVLIFLTVVTFHFLMKFW